MAVEARAYEYARKLDYGTAAPAEVPYIKPRPEEVPIPAQQEIPAAKPLTRE